MYITYAPEYHFEGDAPSREELEGAEEMSQARFNEMMDKWLKDRRRRDF